MTSTKTPALENRLSPMLIEALAFEAPYVVERLVNDRVVDSPTQAEQLFTEVKRYLVMSATTREATVGMCSARVDEAWHAFILYTHEYASYCRRYFARYVGHAPKNAPVQIGEGRDRPTELSFPEFCERYEQLFDELLPDLWYDSRNIVAAQRVFNDSAGQMKVARHGPVAEMLDGRGDALLSANAIVYDALAFVADTGAFYVRELPGNLTDAEKIRVVEALVAVHALRLAP